MPTALARLSNGRAALITFKEQSRAEQSRAEQSRAEQSRAACGMRDRLRESEMMMLCFG